LLGHNQQLATILTWAANIPVNPKTANNCEERKLYLSKNLTRNN